MQHVKCVFTAAGQRRRILAVEHERAPSASGSAQDFGARRCSASANQPRRSVSAAMLDIYGFMSRIEG